MEREEGLRTGGLTAGAAGYGLSSGAAGSGLSSGAAGSGLQSGGLEISNTRRKPYPAINVQTQLEIPVSGGGVAGDKHPWKVSIVPNVINPVTGTPSAVMSIKGNIVETLLSITLLEIEDWDDGQSYQVPITETGAVCLLITRAVSPDPPVITVEFQSDTNYEPYDDDGADPPKLTATRYPLALIVDNPDPPTGGTRADDYIVNQLARSHMSIYPICVNGQSVTSLIPI
jgi:hypothetical protein